MGYDEFLKEANAVSGGYICAMSTDKFLLDVWPSAIDKLEAMKDNLLEVRVFNCESEIKLFRCDLVNEFILRIVDSDIENSDDLYSEFIDERQYFDIDTARSKVSFETDKSVYTTGGGMYNLPYDTMEDVMLQVRYYLKKTPSGKAQCFDWRLVDIVKEEM